MPDSTQRFSDRVDSYVKFRPSYPNEVIDALIAGLAPEATIADIGSGTGILTQLLLAKSFAVQAVEPNAAMRLAAESLLSPFPKFTSVNGTAESTGLPSASCALVVAAQAFHWFDRAKSKIEFQRILKPKGQVALLWNERQTKSTPFLKEYEKLLLTNATDYAAVNHANISDVDIEAFFQPFPTHIERFHNHQKFDYEGLAGRCSSSSYVPAAGHPQHDVFYQKLRQLFEKHQTNNQVQFDYQTILYTARIR